MQKIKEWITRYWYYFVIFFVLLFLFTFELPYYIDTPGGTIDVSSRIEVEDGYEVSGSFHLAYVSELKATIPTYLFAQFKKDWDIIPKQKVVLENENAEDVYFRDRLLLEDANQTAILVAYEKANREVEIISQSLYVTYIDSLAQTELQIGDKIKQVDGHKVSSKSEVSALLNTYEIGDTIVFTVNRNKEEKQCKASVIEVENQKKIGLMITEKRTIQTNPEISFHFKSSESGPSGGLMTTLAIYNSLIEEDLTHGLKIVGTGTINADGSVGAIDGVKYKLKGAEKAKADLFFVPNGKNYDTAIQLKHDLDYEIEIVGVDTFDDALTYLKNYEIP